MLLPDSNMQTFQQQLASLQNSLNQLGQMNQPTSTQNPIASNDGFDWVAGIEGARSLLGKMLAGTRKIAWDNEKPIFYVLQKDANGNPARIQIGNFTLSPEPSMEDMYVTRDDFNRLLSRFDKIDKLLSKEENNG